MAQEWAEGVDVQVIRPVLVVEGNTVTLDGDVAARLVARGRAVYMDDEVSTDGCRFVLLLLPSMIDVGTTMNVHPDGAADLVGKGHAVRLDAR